MMEKIIDTRELKIETLQLLMNFRMSPNKKKEISKLLEIFQKKLLEQKEIIRSFNLK